VECSTYCRFFFSSKLNWLLLPLALTIFALSEGTVLVANKFLGEYNDVLNGKSARFSDNFRLYWGLIAGLAAIHAVLLLLKYYMLNICLALNSTKIHEDMLEYILHSPNSMFDVTPSGTFLNKVTTDMGVLDNSLIVALIDAI
jgi:ABC-type multidrug transport system fused ATPase/permease subunit